MQFDLERVIVDYLERTEVDVTSLFFTIWNNLVYFAKVKRGFNVFFFFLKDLSF